MTYGLNFAPDNQGERLLDASYTNYRLIEVADNPLIPSRFTHRAVRFSYDRGYINTNPFPTNPEIEYLYFVQWSVNSSGVFRPKIAIFSNITDDLTVLGNYGILIRNENNHVVFDSRSKFLKITGYENGPGLDSIPWNTYGQVPISTSINSNTFILCNPFMHPFAQSTSPPNLYISTVDLLFTPPSLNNYDSTTLRIRKLTDNVTGSSVSGYIRGFRYMTSSPLIFADLSGFL